MGKGVYYRIDFDELVGPANRAIDFFTAQCAAARKAVDAWCLIACRFDSLINKDVRKKIGMLIWEAREDANILAFKLRLSPDCAVTGNASADIVGTKLALGAVAPRLESLCSIWTLICEQN